MAVNYANSWVEICNRSLGRLGKGRIDDLISGGELAQYCNLFLGEAIEYVLSSLEWNGLRKRVELARSSTDPVYGYSYAYTLPSDAVTITDVEADGEDWVIEGESLLTEADQVYITYIPRPGSPAELPGYLKKCVSTHLAFLLATPLTVSDSLRALLMQEDQIAMNAAIQADGHRSYPIPLDNWYEDSR